MDKLQKSIVRTIAFYDAVGGIALSKLELYKYLLNSDNNMSLGRFLKKLDRGWPSIEPYIQRYRGFYFLKKNKLGYEKRIEIGKTSIKKRRTAEKMARAISFLPYIKMIALTGSLSHHSTNKNSDIDMLITTKNGHIWTVRMLVSAFMHMLGKRRHGNKTKDRICLNHYISDSSLVLRPNNMFSAHIGASLIPLWSDETTYDLFIKENKTLINSFFSNHKPYYFYNVKKITFKTDFLFSIFEPFLKNVQVKKIRNNFKAKNPDLPKIKEGIFDNGALVFHHPRPINQEAMFLYRKNLAELGLKA